MHTLHDIGVARHIGQYGDAIEVSPGTRWLFTSGTPGLSAEGRLPGDIAGQAEIAWRHIVTLLERAGPSPQLDFLETHPLIRSLDAYEALTPDCFNPQPKTVYEHT
jgi:enamine deaminase RidA (YjgF/YER057c/UK114 family)